MNSLNYTPTLKYLPLKESVLSPREDSASTFSLDDEMEGIRANLTQILENKRWLLAPNQRIELPDLPPEGSVFSLQDFVVRTEEAIAKDLQRTSFDESGQQRRLSLDQLAELRRTGQFTVPSTHLRKQHHVWKVFPAFYSGSDTIQESFWEGIGAALDHLVVYTWSDGVAIEDDGNRLSRWWIPSWGKAIVNGFVPAAKMAFRALKQLVSAPAPPEKMPEGRVLNILDQAETGYILYHLKQGGFANFDLVSFNNTNYCDATWDDLARVCNWCREYGSLVEELCRTRRDHQMHFHLKRSEFDHKMEQERQLDTSYETKTKRDSPLEVRKAALEAHSKWQQRCEKEWIRYLIDLGTDEAVARARLLQAQAIADEVAMADEQDLKDKTTEHESILRRKHPFLSLSKLWLKSRTSRYRSNLKSLLATTFSERLRSKLLENPDLASYAEEHRLRQKFKKEELGMLQTKLGNHREPRYATFHFPLWNPKNWTMNASDGSVRRTRTVQVSLDKWFWRLPYAWNTFGEISLWLMATSYTFLVSGPLSLRALLCPTAFYALKRPDVNGGMEDDPASLTPTLVSRLASFFASLRRSREEFESSPDTGIVGKSVQRVFFRIYAAIKGLVGAAAITAFMVVGTAVATPLAFLTLIGTPVLAAGLTLLGWVVDVLFYDRALRSTALFWNMVAATWLLVVPGLVQGALATLRHTVFHPVVGISGIGWASVRLILRHARDVVTWVVLSASARIPASDSFLAKRTHGPGLAAKTYYRIPVEPAKLCFELVLQQFLLSAHLRLRHKELMEPFRLYAGYMDGVLHPFGFNAVLFAMGPETVARKLEAVVQQQRQQQGHNSRFAHHQADHSSSNSGDIWTTISASIRQANPDVKAAMARHQQSRRSAFVQTQSLRDYEKKIWIQLKRESRKFESPSVRFGDMALRTGLLLADLNLRYRFQGRKIHANPSILFVLV